MKIGSNWIHKDSEEFGTDSCSLPRWIGRLLFMLSSQISSKFNLAPFPSKQSYADWLATSSHQDSYGTLNSVLALIFLLEESQNILEKKVIN
jgi:hypothetical protein